MSSSTSLLLSFILKAIIFSGWVGGWVGELYEPWETWVGVDSKAQENLIILLRQWLKAYWITLLINSWRRILLYACEDMAKTTCPMQKYFSVISFYTRVAGILMLRSEADALLTSYLHCILSPFTPNVLSQVYERRHVHIYLALEEGQ